MVISETAPLGQQSTCFQQVEFAAVYSNIRFANARIQETIFGSEHNLSIFRFQLNGVYHVAVIGQAPPNDIDQRHGTPRNQRPRSHPSPSPSPPRGEGTKSSCSGWRWACVGPGRRPQSCSMSRTSTTPRAPLIISRSRLTKGQRSSLATATTMASMPRSPSWPAS